MIQNDIDLLEEDTFKDPYYFALRLLSLTKNKKKNQKNKRNSHFKFLIQQENYVIDQTTNKIDNAFWVMKTQSIPLNQQVLYFFVPDLKESNAEFQLKMYFISQEEVQQIAHLQINSLTYIQVFLEYEKKIYRQTVSLCLQYTLQYEIYIQKSKLELQNLLKTNQEDNSQFKNAFKKKNNQVIQIDNEKVAVKPKKQQNYGSNILRKSLHFNVKKLIEVKKRKQEMKERSWSQSASKSSFFSKIGEIFISKPSLNSQQPFHKPEKNKDFGKASYRDSQESQIVSPPSIGPHKYNRPQNKSYYYTLNIERQKERQRIKIYQNSTQNQIQIKNPSKISILNVVKVTLLILTILFVFYYLSRPTKKLKVSLSKNWDWINF